MSFTLKSFQQILADMITKIVSETPANDVTPGSVLATLLEAAAQEDFQQYYQLLQIIRNYNLDTTEGSDLDARAAEYGLTRKSAQRATGIITISDSAVVKISTKIYAGLPGPVAGTTSINVDDAATFTPAGIVIVGRGTNNVETVPYTSITPGTNYDTINLSVSLSNDHGTDETVVLSQGGNRVIAAGTVVKVPASDISEEITYSLNATMTLLDGESELTDIEITANAAGSAGNAPVGAINTFDSLPFSTAIVANPQTLTNGADRESDATLRDRIKSSIQSLSRGTKAAVVNAVIGVTDNTDNKRVVSANLVDTTNLNDIARLYIDDGTGFEPSFAGQGQELIVPAATGGERFLQLDIFPLVKAQVESRNAESFPLVSGDTLIYAVNGIEETVTFSNSDFRTPLAGTAEEVVAAINNGASLIEARTSQAGTKVTIRAKAYNNERIRVVGGTANAISKLNFPTSLVETLYIYKDAGATVTQLNKDGTTARLENAASAPYALAGGETLTVVVDGKTANPQTVTFQIADFATPGAALVPEVVARINQELSGAIATATSGGTRITLTSNLDNSNGSKIHVTGGSANAFLAFSTAEVAGSNSDYTLNRFNGQIELQQSLVAGDQLTAGSIQSRAFLRSGNVQPFDLFTGIGADTITFQVDGGGAQIVVFASADFTDINVATAVEVAAVFNRDLKGITATATSDGYVVVRTNTYGTAGSLEVSAVTANAVNLSFPLLSLRTNFVAHTAASESGSAESYTFAGGEQLIVVINGDTTNKTFTIPCSLNGEAMFVDGGAPKRKFTAKSAITSQNFNLKFINKNDLKDFQVKWVACTNVANNGLTRNIIDYNATTGLIELASDLTDDITISDTMIITPRTARNVSTLFNNTISSTLSIEAITEPSSDGTKVQISSLTSGSEGKVQVTGGTAQAILNFSTTEKQGIDGYKYYIGLLRTVQRVVDGLDSDPINYPGYKAAGVQIEVLAPTVQRLAFIVDITLAEGFSISMVVDDVRNKVSSYVNNLGVGSDVVLTEIVSAIMSISGVIDVSILSPTANVTIADGEIARVSEDDIVIG